MAKTKELLCLEPTLGFQNFRSLMCRNLRDHNANKTINYLSTLAYTLWAKILSAAVQSQKLIGSGCKASGYVGEQVMHFIKCCNLFLAVCLA